ncbi:MAG: hypothetical protein JXR84_04590 [Anaerolineae bacterium]|nr:hypothetical protein [Anaerolineae bacterium]
MYFLRALFQARRRPQVATRVICAILAGSVPLLRLAYYNFQCFGNPFLTGYTVFSLLPEVQIETPLAAYTHGSFLQGLWGFLFGLDKGLFVYTPVLLCAIPSSYWTVVQAKRGSARLKVWIVIATIAVSILLFAPYRFWFGGHYMGPRHILPAIPLVALLMAPCWEGLPGWGKVGMVAMALPSVAVHWMLAFLQRDTRALSLSWFHAVDGRLGYLYTDILPLFPTTTMDIWGIGLFRAVKLGLVILIAGLALLLGTRFGGTRAGGNL